MNFKKLIKKMIKIYCNEKLSKTLESNNVKDYVPEVYSFIEDIYAQIPTP